MQRWGQNAKKKGGVESQRKGGVETQMKFYNSNKLLKVAIDRGYRSFDAIANGLSKSFDKTPKSVKNRLISGNLSKEECEVIGSYFKMTMKEYYDVFMNGLFVEDENGHYICNVENPRLHLKPKLSNKSPQLTRQNKIEKILDEIEQI